MSSTDEKNKRSADLVVRDFGIDAPAVISAMAGYDYLEGDPNNRIGIVDPTYNGTGNPRVTFDGDTALSFIQYPYLGNKPKAGDRVILRKLGDGWIIVGIVGGGIRNINFFSAAGVALTTPTAVTPYVCCSVVVPDPGWPYRVGAMAVGYYEAEDLNNNQWDLQVVRDTPTGIGISRQGLGTPTQASQSVAGPAIGGTILTGSVTLYMTIFKIASGGAGRLMAVFGSAYNGMMVWQVPV